MVPQTETDYYSCSLVERAAMNFNGQLDGERFVALCCEGVDGIPGIALSKGAETIKKFMQMRESVILEGDPSCKRRVYTKGCEKCANFQLNKWHKNDCILLVNLSMYPSPCQCKCIYCGIYKRDQDRFNEKSVIEGYENIFSALRYGIDSGIIPPNAFWQLSCGEITIHPYKDKILSLVKNRACSFFTNCFKYDEEIGKNLASNQYSSINLSIDAGTPETWHKVKGVDNFEDVANNLVKYYMASCRPGQITLKYIVLPNINSNLADYTETINIMKVLEIKHLTLACDTRKKYNKSTIEQEELIVSTGYLAAMLHKNGMTFNMFTFSPEERNMVETFAKELLMSGEV